MHWRMTPKAPPLFFGSLSQGDLYILIHVREIWFFFTSPGKYDEKLNFTSIFLQFVSMKTSIQYIWFPGSCTSSVSNIRMNKQEVVFFCFFFMCPRIFQKATQNTWYIWILVSDPSKCSYLSGGRGRIWSMKESSYERLTPWKLKATLKITLPQLIEL